MAGSKQASKQASKQVNHIRVQCSRATVGLAQAHPND